MTNETHETNVPDMDAMDIDGVTYVTIADYARVHNHSGDRLRGMARDAKLPTTKQLFGKWIIAIDAVVPATTPRVATRADGRKPYTVYANDAERDVLDAEYELVDPRAVSRARRAAAAKVDANATN